MTVSSISSSTAFKIPDGTIFATTNTHFCTWNIKPDVRWFKVPGKEPVLQQAWACRGCGDIRWEDVPMEIQI